MPLPDSPIHASLPAAESWLAAADAMDGAATWSAAAADFRAAINADDWTAQLRAARQQAGLLAGRRLAAATESTALPGAPPGRYVVLQYHALYGDAGQPRAAVETLTLQQEPDGAWRVAGYFIR